MPILHPTELFDYESIDNLSAPLITYKDCVIVMDVGVLKAGSFVSRINFHTDSFVLEFIAEDGVTVVAERDVRYPDEF